MELRELTVEDGHAVYEMLQRIGPSENAFRNDAHGLSYVQYREWLRLMHAWSLGDELPEGYVKQWTYWLLDDAGNPVGYGKLREKVTEESKRFGGNIGFAIDPLNRGRGFGSKLFEMLLEQSKTKGIESVYSTVEKYNYSSKRVHEKCGGELVKEDDLRWYFLFR